MNRVIAKFGFILLTTFLGWLGCAEDEGGTGFPPVTELRVLESIPQSGDNTVDPFDQIQLRMNAPVISSSVQNRLKVSVANTGMVIPGFPSTTSGDTIILFNTASALPSNAQIRVDLEAGVTSTGGLVSQPFAMFFTTTNGGGGICTNHGGPLTVQSMQDEIIAKDNFGNPIVKFRFKNCLDAFMLDPDAGNLIIDRRATGETLQYVVIPSTSGAVVNIAFNSSVMPMVPGERITFRFSSEITDQYGNQLGSNTNIDLRVSVFF